MRRCPARRGAAGATAWAVWLALGAGCGAGPDGGAAAADPAGELVPSLEVKVGRDSVHFVFHVTNQSGTAAEMRFGSTQRFDFEVRTPDGTEVWRWSADRVFGQAAGVEVVEPGQTLSYEAGWVHGGRGGALVALGRLDAENTRIEQRAEFELP